MELALRGAVSLLSGDSGPLLSKGEGKWESGSS